MSAPSPEAAAALESLRQLGFRITNDTGARRLIRRDGSQAQLYRLDGKLDVAGHLGNVTSVSRDQAAINAVPIARAIWKDEAERAARGNVKFGKSIESKPYG
jgi:hypothetical protein